MFGDGGEELLMHDKEPIEGVEVVERKDAVFPEKDPDNQSEWIEFLQKNVDGFGGNIESAGRLMVSYQRGRDYIYNKFVPKFEHFNKPDIMVVLDESKAPSVFGSIASADKIYVKKSCLEQYSDYNQGSRCEVVRGDGVLVEIGSSDEIFELRGVEETHHILFGKLKSNEPGINPDLAILSQLDVQEHEYRALRWQIQYAEENNFSDETISVLRTRLSEAKKIRSQEGNT